MPLHEWGVHTNEKRKIASCYIHSKTDHAFHISLKPMIPFMAGVKPVKSDDEEMDSAPYDRPDKAYHILATLRLDGRSTVEKRLVVFVDPEHPLYRKPGGEVLMASRMARDPAGKLRQCSWYFQEVGIDAIFDSLCISNSTGGETVDADTKEPPRPVSKADGLSELLKDLGAEKFKDAEEKTNLGKIEISLQRVTVGEPYYDKCIGTHPIHAGTSPVTAKDADKVSHTTGRNMGQERGRMIEYIEYELVDPGDEIFATFHFFYRSEEILRKYGFEVPKAAVKVKPEGDDDEVIQLGSHSDLEDAKDMANKKRRSFSSSSYDGRKHKWAANLEKIEANRDEEVEFFHCACGPDESCSACETRRDYTSSMKEEVPEIDENLDDLPDYEDYEEKSPQDEPVSMAIEDTPASEKWCSTHHDDANDPDTGVTGIDEDLPDPLYEVDLEGTLPQPESTPLTEEKTTNTKTAPLTENNMTNSKTTKQPNTK